ncbi:MAG: division/cell wall cluster transcriptional repressor MraZ [Novosphingobium sp.]
MAEAKIRYRGQGFSLQREKNRFVLPAQLRNVAKSSSGKPLVCLVKHPEWTCISGFGLSRVDELEAEIDRAAQAASDKGLPFNKELRLAQLNIMSEVPFDNSGRFVMPNQLMSVANLEKELFFHGIGDSFLIWNPDELAKMDGDWAAIQAACEDERMRARAGK